MEKNIKIAASILASDFGCLAKEAIRIEKANIDAIHIDIMDGHFVPNLSLGPKAVTAINLATDIFLDVHLMMYNPFNYIERFIESGADSITFHVEATEDVKDTLKFIRKCGKKAGLACNPETSFSMILPYLEYCDLILFMAVNPGYGGQKFMPKVLEKIKLLKEACLEKKYHLDIQVDGGINAENAKKCISKGANFIVAGTYLFSQKNMEKAAMNLKLNPK